jgi:hypothetical protein
MEQAILPDPVEITGFLKTERAIEPFIARISAPRPSSDGSDFCCSVHAPALVKRDKDIFGASAEQARKLALQFLRSMLEGKNIVDKGGRKIDLERLA